MSVPRLLLAASALAFAAAPAAAASHTLAVLKSGMVIEVRSVDRADGMVRLSLASGGELSMPESQLDRIDTEGYGIAAPTAPVTAPQVGHGPTMPSHPWREAMLLAAQRNALDERLVYAVARVESNLDPRARSPRGALGLMQLMPGTAQDLGVLDPLDPVQSIDGGCRYLRQLIDRFGGDVRLALAAYNAGPTSVADSGGVPEYDETRSYVDRVMAAYASL